MQLENEDEKKPKEDEVDEEKKKSFKLPDESGEELIQKQVVIPSPSWEQFIKKDT